MKTMKLSLLLLLILLIIITLSSATTTTTLIKNVINKRMEERSSSSTLSSSKNLLKFIPHSFNDNNSFESFDRNIIIACTNRYNCEQTCLQVKKFHSTKKQFQQSKSLLIDTIIDGKTTTITDAHKLGIQLGRYAKSCDKCSLIYSNCMDNWYQRFYDNNHNNNDDNKTHNNLILLSQSSSSSKKSSNLL